MAHRADLLAPSPPAPLPRAPPGRGRGEEEFAARAGHSTDTAAMPAGSAQVRPRRPSRVASDRGEWRCPRPPGDGRMPDPTSQPSRWRLDAVALTLLAAGALLAAAVGLYAPL